MSTHWASQLELPAAVGRRLRIGGAPSSVSTCRLRRRVTSVSYPYVNAFKRVCKFKLPPFRRLTSSVWYHRSGKVRRCLFHTKPKRNPAFDCRKKPERPLPSTHNSIRKSSARTERREGSIRTHKHAGEAKDGHAGARGAAEPDQGGAAPARAGASCAAQGVYVGGDLLAACDHCSKR